MDIYLLSGNAVLVDVLLFTAALLYCPFVKYVISRCYFKMNCYFLNV